jgi:hypothetical protein
VANSNVLYKDGANCIVQTRTDSAGILTVTVMNDENNAKKKN